MKMNLRRRLRSLTRSEWAMIAAIGLLLVMIAVRWEWIARSATEAVRERFRCEQRP